MNKKLKLSKLSIIFLLSTTLIISAAATTVKSIYHTHKLSPKVVGISCDNGADPTVLGNPTGGLLIISCGR